VVTLPLLFEIYTAVLEVVVAVESRPMIKVLGED
jgi:hypothetical protein